MTFEFLKSAVEGYAFYAAVAIYITTIVIILSRYVKIIRDRKSDTESKKSKKKKLIIISFLSLILGAVMHAILFHLFFQIIPPENSLDSTLRISYYWSILITFLVFTIILLIGFYLKGTTTLPRHEGPVSGV